MDDAASVFDPLRPKLTRVAYRMLGSAADAEDVVQETFLRWMDADRDAVREPEGFLRRIVTRLCLDLLKSARRRRETYVGTWLPEPVFERADDEPDDVTLPLLMALERLSPLERAAFILHDVFDVDFDEVAQTIGRDPAACRQLASRARTHVRAARPRYSLPPARGRELAEAFFTASRHGDMAALQTLLADDVALYADGGGKRPAIYVPVIGLERVLALHASLARLAGGRIASVIVGYGMINGLPGFVTREPDGLLQTTALQIEEDKVVAVFIVRNPDKLNHLEGVVLH